VLDRVDDPRRRPPEALLVNGGGLDDGNSSYVANCGDYVHAVGSLAPLIEGNVGCVVIRPDGGASSLTRGPDPLAQEKPD
jgi:hypothetical protein